MSSIRCSQCSVVLEAPISFGGTTARCPRCSTKVPIPSDTELVRVQLVQPNSSRIAVLRIAAIFWIIGFMAFLCTLIGPGKTYHDGADPVQVLPRLASCAVAIASLITGLIFTGIGL